MSSGARRAGQRISLSPYGRLVLGDGVGPRRSRRERCAVAIVSTVGGPPVVTTILRPVDATLTDGM
jgi:hypothetical protein